MDGSITAEPSLLDRRATSAAAEWRAGWPIVLAGFFGNILLNMSIMSFGTFMAPLTAAFGWNRTELSMAHTVSSIVGIVTSPLVGYLVDRFGARRVALPGTLLVGLAFAAFSTLNGSIPYWLTLWVIFGAVHSLVMLTVWYYAITNAFTVSRGLALSLNSTGGGIAAMFAPLAANFLIEQEGWRTAFIAMGLGCGGFVAIVCFLALHERSGRHASPRRDGQAAAASDLAGLTVREGLRSWSYVKIMTAFFIIYFLSTTLTVHMIPILTDGGIERHVAVALAGSYGLALIVGKISSGIAADRFPTKYVGATCSFLFTMCYLLLRIPSEGTALRAAAVVLFGLSTGGLAPLIPNLISRYFGLRSFGRLFGVSASIIAIGGSVGPLVAGMIYDSQKSYNLLLGTAIPLLLLSTASLLMLGKYPDFAARAQHD